MESGDGIRSPYQQPLPLWAVTGLAGFSCEAGKGDGAGGLPRATN